MASRRKNNIPSSYMYGGELSIDRITVIDLLINGQKFGLTFVAQSAGRYIEENCIRYKRLSVFLPIF